MKSTSPFKFADENLNRRLIALLKKAQIDHVVDKGGVVLYSPDDEEVVDDLICSIRNQVFSSWQVLTCPNHWIPRYKSYMTQHAIPFHEEWSNNQWWFLIPGKHRPHSWKLPEDPEKPLEHSKYRSIAAP